MPEVVTLTHTQTYPLSAIDEVAKELLVAVGAARCLVFVGEMGAGKTTLIKAIGRALGVAETMASPTFSLVNEYANAEGKPVYHFDFYRLKNEAEALDLGIEEYFDSGHWCLIEWGERIPHLLPTHYYNIDLKLIDAQTRAIRYGKH